LDRANRNLGFTTIKSPVTGVIIDRRVNIGQTVVASLNAPSLFLLAKDLQRMEVWVAVNEADIGNIHQDQPVSFTVDAFPGHTFQGRVAKIRLNASMTQNVVTYTVEVSADNSEKLLLPYLTANVQFEVSRSDNAMLVPNAALRYTPADEQISPAAKEEMNKATSRPSGEASSNSGGGEQRQGRRRRDGAGGAGATSRPSRSGSSGDRWRPGMVWVRDGQFLKPLKVRAGTTDGAQTEIVGQDVTEGMEVVVGQVAQQGSQARGAGGGQQSANPFIPQFPSRGGRGSRGG
jgi:HlyD family secretion protein